MKRSLKSYVGERVSHVTALETCSGYRMKCMCDCGNITYVQGGVFRKSAAEGRGVSCGCMKNRFIASSRTEHGLTHSRTWTSWASMLDRCNSKHHKSYEDYGGRGVSVCERWKQSFCFFLEDMGIRPDGTTLGRIDNDGDYSKENCRWETVKEQARNRRSSRFIECFGERLTLVEWTEKTGIPHDTLMNRLKRWDAEKALTHPVKRRSNSRDIDQRMPA